MDIPSPSLNGGLNISFPARGTSACFVRRLRRRRLTRLYTRMDNGDTERTPSDHIAQRILEACQKRDEGASVTYVGRDDEGQTVVRVRSSKDASISALQTSMKGLFPFARVRTNENVLTGTLQAEILVPNAADEWKYACDNASSGVCARLLKLASFACIVGAGAFYAQDLMNS